jgi:hypothetical protein
MTSHSSNQSATANAVPTMETAIASIVGRPLTDADRQMLIRLRDQYGYDDNDPLVVVLAMTGAIKIMAEEIPEKIRAASKETTELHMAVLRDQSMLVARDVVGSVAGLIHTAGRTKKDRITDGVIGSACGALLTAVVIGLSKYFHII